MIAKPDPIAWTDPRLGPSSPIYRIGALLVIDSDDQDFGDGQRWHHVSFSTRRRLPDWNEIKLVRTLFFPPDAEVIQVFPPVDEWVNTHAYTFHLWQCKTRRLTPPAFQYAVGIPGIKLR
jgi:hypothetical protein